MISEAQTQVHFGKEHYPKSPWIEANFVPGVGPKNARIMVIGEAPGKNENEQGLPFVGGAGNMLNSLLKNAELSRNQIYITNVIKYRPPKNNINDARARKLIRDSIGPLIQEIKYIKPNVIVPTGNVALQALGFNYRIGQARGTIFQSDLGKIIPTYHPAYIFRQFHEIVTVQKDWEKIARHQVNPELPVWHENFDINPTVRDVEIFARTVKQKADYGQNVKLGIDLETFKVDSPLETPIKTIGISHTKNHAIVIPLITQAGNSYWKSQEDIIRVFYALGTILEDSRLLKMFHNALFDALVLMNHGFNINRPIYDTMIAQYLVYHPSPHGLDYLTSIYSDFEPWKLTYGNDDESFRKYNARDCIVLNACHPALDQDVTDNGVRSVFNLLMNNLLPTCRMILNGVHIHQERFEQVKQELESDINKLVNEMKEMTGREDFNPDSDDQLRDYLFKELKLRSDVKTKTGKKSTSKDVLNRLSNRYPDLEFIDKLLYYRTVSTRYSTFIKNLHIHKDGRIHSQFSMHTAVSGRFSSSNPNLQNLPARTDQQGYIRSMYGAPPGRIIVTADYSQLELMIFSIIAEDPVWIDAFEKGVDIHAFNGRTLMGDLYDDKKYRTFIKNFIYGLIYGSEGSEIEKEAPRELIDKISVREMLTNLQNEHPWVFQYRNTIEDSIRKRRYVRNAYGRKRWFMQGYDKKKDEVKKDALRAGINHPIQGTAADIMHEKMAALDEAITYPTDMLILQLHDQFYIETEEERLDTVAKLMKHIMEEPVYTPLGYEFKLKADVEYGKTLAKNSLKEWTGEDGES